MHPTSILFDRLVRNFLLLLGQVSENSTSGMGVLSQSRTQTFELIRSTYGQH